jgi:hypothetical protein
MASFGQFAATSQFYLYGRQNFTATGYEKAMKKFLKVNNDVDILADPELSLKGRVAIVTGANSGVGKEIATFLAKKGATLYMVCRSRERGEAAMREIHEISGGNPNLHLLVCDVSLEADVRKMWQEFCASENAKGAASGPKLQILCCNGKPLAVHACKSWRLTVTVYACYFLQLALS